MISPNPSKSRNTVINSTANAERGFFISGFLGILKFINGELSGFSIEGKSGVLASKERIGEEGSGFGYEFLRIFVPGGEVAYQQISGLQHLSGPCSFDGGGMTCDGCHVSFGAFIGSFVIEQVAGTCQFPESFDEGCIGTIDVFQSFRGREGEFVVGDDSAVFVCPVAAFFDVHKVADRNGVLFDFFGTDVSVGEEFFEGKSLAGDGVAEREGNDSYVRCLVKYIGGSWLDGCHGQGIGEGVRGMRIKVTGDEIEDLLRGKEEEFFLAFHQVKAAEQAHQTEEMVAMCV